VLPWDDDPEFGWWDGRVEECDLELDLAVVSVRGLAEGVASLPWGRLEGSDPVPWKAVGFPVAGLDETGRQPEHTWGEVSPVTASPAGRLGLVIRSRETRPTARGTSGWAGLSGAAVFCNDRLVGVVIEDPEEFTESLTARRVDRLANNELLYIAAGSPVFEGVSAESADDPGQDAPCQLRAPAKDFTGREEEVEQLVDALARHAESEEADLAIAVISGMPGIGKTELAVQVGHELRKSHDFPDGQLYVDLRGAEEQSHRGGEEESDQEPAMEPLEVLGRFLRALGAQGGQIGESLQERMDDYNRRLKNRRVLLVLDNAADEGQVEPLLPYEGRCAVIVTSRARLTFPETDVHIDLPVLSTDEAQELFTRIAGKKQGIGDNRSVREIVELCGNLPLAVRIAGANLATKPNLTPQRLARSLSNEKRRLALLKRGDRQVRASFALSYRGLLPGEQLLFRLLGILPAQDFAVWGAAALIGRDVDDTEELVTGLVDAQLLQFIGDDESDLSRYRFHDLLRLFARESLEEEESAEVQRAALERLISACVALTDFAAEVLRRSEEHAGQTFEATWPATDATVAEAVVGNPHGWFSAERPTLIWAVQQGYEAGRFEATWRLAGNLADFFDVQGYWSDWQNTHEVGLEAARLAEDRFGEAAILQRLGLAHLRQGEGHWRDAIGCLEQSRGLFDELREPLEAAVTRRNLGRVYREQEQWDKATESYEQCLTAFRALGNRHWEARTLRSLADVHYDRGDLTEAVGCFRQCIQIYDDLRGNPRWKASVLRSLGDVYRRQKRWDEAIDSYKECLKVFKEMSARWWTAATLRGLGNAYRAKQQWDEAIRHYEESIRIFEELGNRRWQAKATASLGVALAQKGDHDAAAEQWRQALTTFDEIGAAEAGHVRAWLTAAGERDLHR
jgi:tetratricopeptide (TPR) repeat protein